MSKNEKNEACEDLLIMKRSPTLSSVCLFVVLVLFLDLLMKEEEEKFCFDFA